MTSTRTLTGYTGESLHGGKLAVIDIGSNSVRLVVYDGLGRAPLPLYNEKQFCALGKGLGNTGKLNPEGVSLARIALARFIAIARVMDVVELDVLATAAIRDAKDGEAFVESLERDHNISITVLSGKKEARFAAYGVLSSIFMPEGVAGDLGGGSMELVQLDNTTLKEQATLQIGVLRLLDEHGRDRDKIRKAVQKNLEELSWLSQKKAPYFYAIGGTFRAIARQHMLKVNYPLSILHHYTVAAELMQSFVQEMAQLKMEEIEKLPGVSGKRVPAYMPACIILDQLIRITRPEKILFCTSGIREGYLYDKLSPYLKMEDPLIAAATDVAVQSGHGTAYAREVCSWMQPLFPKEKERQFRLRFSACLLGEITWRVQPDYRASASFHRILQSSLIGLSHKERVMLALASYHRHQFKLKDDFSTLTLIDEKDALWARLVGRALNLAYSLSGGVEGTLGKITLELEKDRPALSFPAEYQALMSEGVKKRLDGLGEIWSACSSLAK